MELKCGRRSFAITIGEDILYDLSYDNYKTFWGPSIACSIFWRLLYTLEKSMCAAAEWKEHFPVFTYIFISCRSLVFCVDLCFLSRQFH